MRLAQNAQWQHSLPKLVLWLWRVLWLLLLWFLAALIWACFKPTTVPQTTFIALNNQQSFNLANYPLFSQPQQTTTSVAPSQMVLQGVFVGKVAGQGAALISVNGVSKQYRVGQPIEQTGYTLQQVNWHSATVNQGGVASELKLGNPDFKLDNTPKPQNLNPPVNVVNANPGTASAALEQELVRGSQQMAGNANNYLSQMGLTATDNGYVVSDKTPIESRQRLNLQPGDKVISINGQRLGVPQEDARILDQVRQTRQAQIEVQRGNSTITLQQSF